MSECDETLEDLIQPSLLFPPFSCKKLSDLPQVTPLRATELSLESGLTCPALSLCVLFIALPGEINAPPTPCLPYFCPIWLGSAQWDCAFIKHTLLSCQVNVIFSLPLALQWTSSQLWTQPSEHKMLVDDTDSSSSVLSNLVPIYGHPNRHRKRLTCFLPWGLMAKEKGLPPVIPLWSHFSIRYRQQQKDNHESAGTWRELTVKSLEFYRKSMICVSCYKHVSTFLWKNKWWIDKYLLSAYHAFQTMSGAESL